MQCRACRAESVVRLVLPRWKSLGFAALLAARVQCRHCFFRFLAPSWHAARLESFEDCDARSSKPTGAAPLVLPMAWRDVEHRRAA